MIDTTAKNAQDANITINSDIVLPATIEEGRELIAEARAEGYIGVGIIAISENLVTRVMLDTYRAGFAEIGLTEMQMVTILEGLIRN